MPNNQQRPRITIRTMTIDDLAPVFHLGEKIFTYRKSPTLYRTWDEFEVAEFFVGSNECCFVAEMNEKIIGFLLGYIIDRKKASRKVGYLTWIGVDHDIEGRGVAHRLFEKFHQTMEENEVELLLVDSDASNKRALDFFERVGFTSPRDHLYLSLKMDEWDRP
ncbi:GNAT family N-acetyltransferase [Desulfurispira natronophila]|uniref:Ribosomal protein S18 acetylase RimI-like enzyme n=1 Tax=Desulfurispira natronophila TaxID=682562 RepID=A0A7W7Y5J8_9BACT|nr:GNAT family N-acetyltransferase [Desulfurispira natronophila]MBB5022314.1 ribosomal protein S18 acetylase RimI-like enzyme [Desulfurispira natronophila]